MEVMVMKRMQIILMIITDISSGRRMLGENVIVNDYDGDNDSDNVTENFKS